MAEPSAAPGKVYGLGVGPGDPELITLKSLRLLRACPVLAYPAPETGDSLARGIIAEHLPGDQIEIPIRMPLEVARFPAQAVYDQAAKEIAAQVAQGRDVAVICQGDPFFYGSFMYLFGRLAETCPVQVVPGVSSLTACAAALGAPLAARNDILAVLPGPLPEDELSAALDAVEAAAIIKLGRHFGKVRRVLDSLGLIENARYVAHATMGDQTILPLASVEAEDVPYFSMILVHRRGSAWQ